MSSSASQQHQLLTPQQNYNAETTNESKCHLQSLLAKETSANAGHRCLIKKFPSFALSRSEAVDWILKVHEFYSFSAHTVILAVNYFDRFFARFGFPHASTGKPWMIHLVAVACLTLAAKMEEIHVPLLVDFQVEDAKYVFEANTIQKTEVLILATLDWEMNAATPVSFIEHLVINLGLTSNEYLSMCEDILLRALADADFVKFRPSVMAAAAILNVISTLEPCIMPSVLKQISDTNEGHTDKLELDECRSFLQHSSSKYHQKRHNKHGFSVVEDIPKEVLDALFNSDNSDSDDSRVSSSSSSPSSSTEPVSKRTKFHNTHEYQECIKH